MPLPSLEEARSSSPSSITHYHASPLKLNFYLPNTYSGYSLKLLLLKLLQDCNGLVECNKSHVREDKAKQLQLNVYHWLDKVRNYFSNFPKPRLHCKGLNFEASA